MRTLRPDNILWNIELRRPLINNLVLFANDNCTSLERSIENLDMRLLIFLFTATGAWEHKSTEYILTSHSPWCTW